MVKKFVCLLVLLFLCNIVALTVLVKSGNSTITNGEVQIAWDTSMGIELVEYRLYQSYSSGGYQFDEGVAAVIPFGQNTITLTGVPDGTWFWVLTVVDSAGNESDASNEITEVFVTLTKPPTPTGLMIVE